MTPQQKLIQIVDSAGGEDLERARRAFGHMSESELERDWGQSGRTCRQILKGYEDERALYQRAKALLMEKLDGEG